MTYFIVEQIQKKVLSIDRMYIFLEIFLTVPTMPLTVSLYQSAYMIYLVLFCPKPSFFMLSQLFTIANFVQQKGKNKQIMKLLEHLCHSSRYATFYGRTTTSYREYNSQVNFANLQSEFFQFRECIHFA